ncbi:hypothetical protein HDU97_000340 [Phlyctochytrium planicorne]|nr:hypothetical protein HDU97_000340 [Phlyctochytrium planicorne]
MDVSSLFKTPTASASSLSSAKRKLPDEPSDAMLKRLRGDAVDGGKIEDFKWGVGVASERAGGEKGSSKSEEPDEDDPRFYGDGLSEKQRAIMEIVDGAEENPANIDVSFLKKVVLRLEKAINKNTELRMRHGNDPLKFIESEADLDDEINALSKVSEAPHLYPQLVNLGAVASIVSLLSHENTDIAIAAINLINELTDEDTVGDEDDEGLQVLVKSLLENQVLELLVENLERFNENSDDMDDKQGVFSSLGVFENLVSADPQLAEVIIEKTTLLPWLLKRIAVRQFDSNRQYSSEIISILLQNSRKNRLAFIQAGGIVSLLQVIAYYKRRDPQESDEIEMMENFFDSLCLALAEPEGKEAFLNEEGVELMLIILKEKKMAKMRALKVLDHALLGDAGKGCCSRFIEILGLKTLFPLFMKKGQRAYRKSYKSYSESDEEEHIVSIIFSLIKNSTEKEQIGRIALKFAEADFEKLLRLLDMQSEYQRRVSTAEVQLESGGSGLAFETPEELYLRKLDLGLFTLQLINLIIGILSVQDAEPEVALGMQKIVRKRKGGYELVANVIQEYADNSGDSEDGNMFKEHLNELVQYMKTL